MEGLLEPRLLVRARSAGDADVSALRKLRAELADGVAALGDPDTLTIEWGPGPLDDATARRWCWVVPWILFSQDEDLFLMADDLVAPLLEEAGAGCPKRAYVFSIALHHVRDQANAALRNGSGAVRARIRELVRFRQVGVDAGHETFVAYLDRLARYERPGKVDREGACARVSDLWRCHAPPAATVEAAGNEWRAQSSTTPAHEEWIVIDAKTGAMHLDAPWQARAKKRGRHR